MQRFSIDIINISDVNLKKSICFLSETISNECYPLVLLEAMQANLLIISPYEGSNRDILRGTGFLVRQQDARAL